MKIVLDTQEVTNLIETHISSLGFNNLEIELTNDGATVTVNNSSKKSKPKTKPVEIETIEEETLTDDNSFDDNQEIDQEVTKPSKSVFD